MDDLSKSIEFFRRAKDRGGDTKLLAKGLLHLIKHTEPARDREQKKAEDLLNKAWKYAGQSSLKNIAEALYLVTKGMKSKPDEDE